MGLRVYYKSSISIDPFHEIVTLKSHFSVTPSKVRYNPYSLINLHK